MDVVIDPGQAFGTGAHATTALCLELLLELADAGEARGPLADLGTGSGVLAIAAAKLGWAPVLGCDSEAAAIEAAAANARANAVEVELERVNLREQAPPTAPTMAANLTAPLLRDVAGRLDRAAADAGLLGAARNRGRRGRRGAVRPRPRAGRAPRPRRLGRAALPRRLISDCRPGYGPRCLMTTLAVTFYDVVVWLHVTAVVVGLGPTFAYGVYIAIATAK